jgi:hypothetical protein
MDMTREGGLLAWQLREYPNGHRNRRNLLIHAVTVPLFQAGVCALALAAAWDVRFLAISGPALLLPMALQGRTHRLEARAPLPFRGPLDFAARIVAEQLITFPRFVLAGGFASAWRASSGGRASGRPADDPKARGTTAQADRNDSRSGGEDSIAGPRPGPRRAPRRVLRFPGR